MKLIFKADDHSYTSDDDPGRKWTSVTTLIHHFKEPFDQLKIAGFCSRKKTSKWFEMEPEKIVEYWNKESERANMLGTWYHDQREKDVSSCETIRREGVDLPIFKPLFENNVKVAPDQALVPGIYPEHFMYLKSAGICGQADRIEIVGDIVNVYDYKGLALDTIVPTKDGHKLLNDIIEGDIIFDGNGNLTNVEHVSAIHYNPCYKLTFDTGETLICDHEHKWVITNRNCKGFYNDSEKTTDELYSLFLQKKELRIKNTDLKTTYKELPIDPYVLGAWLGDGSQADGTITNMNNQIWQEFETRGYKLGKDVSQGGSGKAQTRTLFGLRTQLIKLNILNNKHIPNIYLRASYEQRLDLLRGFMDTDGYYHLKRKRCVMVTTKLWQKQALCELVASLGWKPTCFTVKGTGFGKSNITMYHIVFNSLNTNPFLCKDVKFSFDISSQSFNKARFRYIRNIEPIETVPTKCLAVDSSDHTYLVTANYIKTHNTNKKIETEGYTNWEGITKKMLHPLEHLDDCNLIHYTLQLSFYMYMVLKHNPNLKPGKLTLQHIIFAVEDEDEFGFPINEVDIAGDPVIKDIVLYEVPYLKNDIATLLNYIKTNPSILDQ